jgi:16S rRNA (uracil1498-N3)-methyltransferase
MGGLHHSDIELPLKDLSHHRVGAIVTVQVEGTEYRARITGIAHDKATLRLFEQLSRPSESTLAITLIQALPKKEKMELIIQKATELGVTSIVPCISAKSISLSERDASQSKSLRWAAVTAKAVEQSRRRLIPRIEECTDLIAALQSASGTELKLMLYEKEVSVDLHSFADKSVKTIAIAAGPEGGFTDGEVALARSFGYVPVNLGGRILRCETASIAAISIAQFLWGDL